LTEYADLLYFLTWRDIKVRYKQTAFGVAWALLQPIATAIVFSLFFGGLAKMPSDGAPYPVFVFTAVVPWSFFANALTQAAQSLVLNEHLIRRVYFPRLIVPVSTVLAGAVDFVLGFIVLAVVLGAYDFWPTMRILWVVPLSVLAAVAAAGIGLWFAAVNVRYRDVRHALPFVVQLWLLVTPVAYPSRLLSDDWRMLYALNPMVGVVEGFRWALLDLPDRPDLAMGLAALMSLVIFVAGARYFRSVERTFTDVI
jgi:lipopolysaccharide transport system permease protein